MLVIASRTASQQVLLSYGKGLRRYAPVRRVENRVHSAGSAAGVSSVSIVPPPSVV